MLKFDKSWRFNSPGPAPQGVIRDFYGLIEKIVAQGDAWAVVEQCKDSFGGSGTSSSLSWAWTDLSNLMDDMAENARSDSTKQSSISFRASSSSEGAKRGTVIGV